MKTATKQSQKDAQKAIEDFEKEILKDKRFIQDELFDEDNDLFFDDDF